MNSGLKASQTIEKLRVGREKVVMMPGSYGNCGRKEGKPSRLLVFKYAQQCNAGQEESCDWVPPDCTKRLVPKRKAHMSWHLASSALD
jgi:hypothetical protein